MRPLWFTSGVFFSINTVAQLRSMAEWNPILQAIELSRSALSVDYYINPDIISLPYLLLCSGVTSLVGLWVYQNNEKLLLTR